jgi:CDP-glucose 4,6-dehydratase
MSTSSHWGARRVLVTGATGMVGSWLVKELLARSAYVVALVRDADPQSELLRSGDIAKVAVVNGGLEDFGTVERAINEHETDTVFHLGAQTIVGVAHRFPLATWEANVRGTYNLLEACRIHSDLVERIVVASSDKAYGATDDLPYTEETPLNGRHPYEASKACSELIARSYHHTYGLRLAIARCANVYGGGDLNWSRIVPGTIRSFHRAERPVLRSDGSFVRDYFYVKDAVGSYLDLADGLDDEHVTGEAFNFSTEESLTVTEMVDEVRRLMGCDGIDPEIRDDAVGEIREQRLSAAKASAVLGWRPKYELEQGLSETIAWYRDFLG